MNTIQTDLVITGAHTVHPTIYWKGQEVPNVVALKVASNVVTLVVPEDPLLAELASNGIKIVRGQP